MFFDSLNCKGLYDNIVMPYVMGIVMRMCKQLWIPLTQQQATEISIDLKQRQIATTQGSAHGRNQKQASDSKSHSAPK